MIVSVRDKWQRYHQQHLFTDRAVAQASYRGNPGSIPGQSMWDLWWTESTGKGFSSNTSLFPCQHGHGFLIIHSSYHDAVWPLIQKSCYITRNTSLFFTDVFCVKKETRQCAISQQWKKTHVFRDKKTCTLVQSPTFRGPRCFRNVGKCTPIYKASYTRNSKSSNAPTFLLPPFIYRLITKWGVKK